MTLTPWLRQHLINTGVLTERGITRRAVPRRCTVCNAHVIIGLDADRAALETACDPVPLSPLGEALALVAGSRTLTLDSEAGRVVLNPRDDLQIAANPAGTVDVLREHQCRRPAPAPAETLPTRPVRTTRPLPTDPPF